MKKDSSAESIIQKALKLTFGPKGKRFTPCPHGCGLVRAEKFAKHLKRVHAGKPALVMKVSKVKVHQRKSKDALSRAVSGGRCESNRRKY